MSDVQNPNPTIPAGPVRLAHADLLAAELAAFAAAALLDPDNPNMNHVEARKILEGQLRPRLASAAQRLRYELSVSGNLGKDGI